MAYSLISNTSLVINTASGTTSAIDTTGADLIVVGISQYVGSPIGVLSDNKGNTWTSLTSKSGTISYSIMAYVNGGTVGTGHTFTLANSLTLYASVFVLAFSGSINPAFDVENGASTTGTSLATGSVTPSLNNSLIISMAGITDNSATPYNCTLLTKQGEIAWVTGNNEGGAIAWAVQSVAAAINPTWSWTTSAEASVNIAAFSPAATLAWHRPVVSFFR